MRQEIQTHLGDSVNVAPRGGLTWAPFKSGKTTIRAGGGIFYDWLEADVYEQTLRVDGVRQADLVVRSPGYPDPFDGGLSEVLPPSKYLLAGSLLMPERRMVNFGLGGDDLALLSTADGSHAGQADRFGCQGRILESWGL